MWDPLTLAHQSLIADLSRYAAQRGRRVLVIVLEPNPVLSSAVVRQYRHGWPVYDDVQVRIALLRRWGADTVMLVEFDRPDFAATAAQFLDVVRARADIRELWLGFNQMLGPGPAGSQPAVVEYAAQHSIRVRLMDRPPPHVYDVHALLSRGELSKAAAQVGRPPVWSIPNGGTLNLAWKPGSYRATALSEPHSPPTGRRFDVVLFPQPNAEPASLICPERTGYLAFLSGPGDPA